MMKTGKSRTTSLLLAAALLASQEALAVKVYQWTDEEGVVHFSDTPPQGDTVAEISEMELYDAGESTADPDEYSIVNQLERMTEWRRQAEEDRRAWKQLQLEEERLAQEQKYYQPVVDDSTNTYLLNDYYPYSYYPRTYNYPTHGYYPRFMKRHDGRFFDKDFSHGARRPHRSSIANKNFGKD